LRVRTGHRASTPPSPRHRRAGSAEAINLCGVFLLGLLLPECASAQDRFAGAWKIEKAEPAPWVQTPDVTDAAEIKRMAGATITFKADRIGGPDPIACGKPHYAIRQFQANELFQGALAEMSDPASSPDKLADKLGFGKRPIPSLDTGCASGIDFHLLDGDHAMFALNNTLYRMTRAAGGKKRAPK
jgi:hypothetical protein